jgi:prophage maintenance system killer protein
MSTEIIQGVAYDNYDDFFNMSTSYFHKISFHYFGDYLMTKLTLE